LLTFLCEKPKNWSVNYNIHNITYYKMSMYYSKGSDHGPKFSTCWRRHLTTKRHVELATCFVPWFAKPLLTTTVEARSYRNNTGVTTVVNHTPREMFSAILVYNVICLCMHWEIRHNFSSWTLWYMVSFTRSFLSGWYFSTDSSFYHNTIYALHFLMVLTFNHS